MIPEEKAEAGRKGAHISWSHTQDRAARTSNGREALRAAFLAQADGDAVRAEHLWKAHFADLALKSAKARRLACEAEEARAALAAVGGDCGVA